MIRGLRERVVQCFDTHTFKGHKKKKNKVGICWLQPDSHSSIDFEFDMIYMVKVKIDPSVLCVLCRVGWCVVLCCAVITVYLYYHSHTVGTEAEHISSSSVLKTLHVY